MRAEVASVEVIVTPVVSTDRSVCATSFDFSHFCHEVAEQFCLTAQAVRRLELLVRLIGCRRAELIPSFHDLDAARAASAVATTDVAQGDLHLHGALQY